MTSAVGIDLGTTYSAAAWLRPDGRTEMIPNNRGKVLTPSVVLFGDTEILVGDDALDRAAASAERLAQWVKRDTGKALYSRPILGQQIPPEAIQACVLRQIQADVARHLGGDFRSVITVPAYFDEPRRRSTMEAAQMAGLDVADIINEPTAAALAFGEQLGYLRIRWDATAIMRTLVFDLGGGTFDVTLMDVEPQVFSTLATDGDAQLGGVDWDLRLADYAATEFQKLGGIDPRLDPRSAFRLHTEAERVKRILSSAPQAMFHVECGGAALDIPVTRALFEHLTADLLQRTSHTTRSVLTAAGCSWREISRVLLVGGSTRMPMVYSMLKELSGILPDRGVDPDEAVARGAAIFAAQTLSGQERAIAAIDCRITNVNSHSLGVQGIEVETGLRVNHIVIPKNTPLPTQVTKKFVTTKLNQRSLAIQVLEGESRVPSACTLVGSTIVRDLPPGLPKGSRVDITFGYAANGRLQVTVSVPGTSSETRLELECSGARNAAQVARWRQTLAANAGLTSVAATAAGELGVPRT